MPPRSRRRFLAARAGPGRFPNIPLASGRAVRPGVRRQPGRAWRRGRPRRSSEVRLAQAGPRTATEGCGPHAGTSQPEPRPARPCGAQTPTCQGHCARRPWGLPPGAGPRVAHSSWLCGEPGAGGRTCRVWGRPHRRPLPSPLLKEELEGGHCLPRPVRELQRPWLSERHGTVGGAPGPRVQTVPAQRGDTVRLGHDRGAAPGRGGCARCVSACLIPPALTAPC